MVDSSNGVPPRTTPPVQPTGAGVVNNQTGTASTQNRAWFLAEHNTNPQTITTDGNPAFANKNPDQISDHVLGNIGR